MKLTEEGFRLIKAHEGLRLAAYPDPGTGGEPWTIGYGHTSAAGEPKVYKGLVITKAQADEILRRDLGKFEADVKRMVKVPLNDNQYSALLSFCFNVGPGNFQKSGVLKAVNAKLFHLVPSRLALWNKAAGRVLPGLTRRRAEEGKLFVKPVIGPTVVHDDEDDRTPVPDKPQGKPITKSTTAGAATIAGAAGAAGPAIEAIKQAQEAAEAGKGIWDVAASVGPWVLLAVVIVAAAAYVIWQRKKKSDLEGV